MTFAKLHQDRELAKELNKDEFLKCFQKDLEVLKTIEHKEPFYTFYKDSLRTVYTDNQKLTLMEYIHGLIQKDDLETVQRIFKFCEIDRNHLKFLILYYQFKILLLFYCLKNLQLSNLKKLKLSTYADKVEISSTFSTVDHAKNTEKLHRFLLISNTT